MSSLTALFRAVAIGTLAGAAPGLLFTVPFGLAILLGDGNFGGLWIMLAPIIIAAPLVLCASLLLGLPLTAVLARLGKERGQYYVVAGLMFGAAPFLIWMQLPNGLESAGLLPAAGALGGAMAGWTWGRHRDELADRNTERADLG